MIFWGRVGVVFKGVLFKQTYPSKEIRGRAVGRWVVGGVACTAPQPPLKYKKKVTKSSVLAIYPQFGEIMLVEILNAAAGVHCR